MANLKYYDSGAEAWETLVIGKQGPTGPEGPAGPGFPAGGATGQVLAKTSSVDYATEWVAPSGLTLLGTHTVSGAAKLLLDDVFSATYDNYRIAINVDSSSALADMFFRLRASGSPLSASSYVYGEFYVGALNGAGFASTSNTTQTALKLSGTNITNGSLIFIEVVNPFDTQSTKLNSFGGGSNLYISGGAYTATTSADGFEIYPGAGTITGEIRVYGYRKS